MPAKKQVAWKPKGYHTVTPAIIVHDAPAAIEFYVKGLGAKERSRAIGPGGKVWHAEIEVGDSIVMVSDEFPEMGAKSAKAIGDAPGGLWVYIEDVDAAHARAVGAGAKSIAPPTDQFWGDRMAIIEDPFGHTWTFAAHTEDVSPEEIVKRREAAMAQMGGGHPPSG